jgi:hypothetical protein
MIGRAFSCLLILLGIGVLAASTSRPVMEYIVSKRDNEKWYGLPQLNHGDLASMSGLCFLSKFESKYYSSYRRAEQSGAKNRVLFIHGDSYLWKISGADSAFSRVSSMAFVGWNTPYLYHLDTSKKNILVIEVSERLMRDYFRTTKIIDELRDPFYTSKKIGCLNEPPVKGTISASFFPGINISLFFNKFINQNLQCNLFNYNFMTPMFGSKAAINYYLFSRASGDVVISQNKEFLFFKAIISPTGTASSRSPVPDDEIGRLVHNFNTIYDYYIMTGFREVYLSIIPSTVTIIEPQGYNALIPRIQFNPSLKMKIIDYYSMAKQSKEDLFFRGDTHWNMTGKQKWIDMVNKTLNETLIE